MSVLMIVIFNLWIDSDNFVILFWTIWFIRPLYFTSMKIATWLAETYRGSLWIFCGFSMLVCICWCYRTVLQSALLTLASTPKIVLLSPNFSNLATYISHFVSHYSIFLIVSCTEYKLWSFSLIILSSMALFRLF